MFLGVSLQKRMAGCWLLGAACRRWHPQTPHKRGRLQQHPACLNVVFPSSSGALLGYFNKQLDSSKSSGVPPLGGSTTLCLRGELREDPRAELLTVEELPGGYWLSGKLLEVSFFFFMFTQNF